MKQRYIALILREPNFHCSEIRAQWAVEDSEQSIEVTVMAESLDDVWAQLNHGSGHELPGYHGRSMSCGDVVLAPNGRFMVDRVGWIELP